eukprot:CAMPEP_0198138846 /NCGR_PEP_ID=MMETSP1443-20131203/2230_1 /TAXON_ID=186043 /ORGANISM="Entomoneis sp., Strain CCMP2396" /LENGTH=186 /DNA_ID=CAMNT_0043800787 /DNA_START=72 /DNA_END=632 /DNA_ORIENTATION=-
MSCRFLFVSLVAFLAITDALVTPDGRRRFLSRIAGGAAASILISVAGVENANAAIAKTGPSSPWTGDYDDPGHPGCLRQVKVVGAPLRGDGTRSPYPVVEVKGYDGSGSGGLCTERPTRADIWTVTGSLKNNEAKLDFSSKGGPKDLLAKYEDGGIVFPDGNKWTKVLLGTKNRMPEDMRTLKSLN